MKEEEKKVPGILTIGSWQADSGATFCSAFQWQGQKAQDPGGPMGARPISSIPAGGQSHRELEKPDRRTFLF